MMPRSIARDRRALLVHVVVRVHVHVLAVAAAGAALSCGGAPAAPQAPASSAAVVAAAPPPPPPDLGPVSPPPGLVVSGTLPKLGGSLATVHGWTQLPMPQSEQVTEILAGSAIGAIADLDQPIDVAVSVAGAGTRMTTSVAVSAGVTDIDAAKTALATRYRLVPGDNGALVIESLAHPAHPESSADAPDDGKTSDEDEDDARVCELAPAYGAPAFRLVCGWDAKALTALGPWLTRGATRERIAGDGHLQVRMEPLKPTIAEQRKLVSMLLGTVLGGRVGLASVRELVQAIGGDMADFATDLDTLSLDVTLSDPGAAATLTLKLSGATSALAKVATANADRNGPPPAAFWQMPGDADFAVFYRGLDPNVLARGRDLSLKVATDRLADDGVKDADRHAVIDALGKMVSSAPMVLSSGVDADAAKKTLAAEKALPDTADAAERREVNRAAAQSLLGWRIIELDEPAAARIDAMKALVAAWARPGVSGVYRAKAGAASFGIRSVPLRTGAVGGALPKDAQHFVVDMPLGDPLASVLSKPAKSGSRPAGSPKPLVLDVFVVPDGARTWMGMGGDAALVTSRLAAAVGGSGNLLGARPELATLKDVTVGAGGFFTARGLPETAVQLASLGGGDPGGFANGAELFESAAQLPHQGMTPIPFSLTAFAGGQGDVVATLQVSRATVDDILVTALKHGF